jgi:hypothetical protein
MVSSAGTLVPQAFSDVVKLMEVTAREWTPEGHPRVQNPVQRAPHRIPLHGER